MKLRRGIRLNSDQFDEMMLNLNRIATTFEHMHKMHKEWFEKEHPHAISGKINGRPKSKAVKSKR